MNARAMTRRAAGPLALTLYLTLLVASAPRWPDDWDGIGFVESVHDFDIERFHPHPPGYPVYVALLRAAAAVVGDSFRAAVLVAAVSGAVAIALTWDAVRRLAGERAAWTAASLAAVAPGIWRACSGVGSEAPALAAAAACAWGLVVLSRGESVASRAASIALGAGAGLGLGVRLSWGPIYAGALALAPRFARPLAWGIAAVSCAAWGGGLIAAMGGANLARVYGAHFAGHAVRWGGTIVTEPGWVRFAWMARDIFVDGMGAGRDPLGLAVGVFGGIAGCQAFALGWETRWRGWRRLSALFVPYVIWIGLGQNLRDQPRHTVPLVALLLVGLAIPAARSRRAAAIAGALAVLLLFRTTADAYVRRTVPPPGQQLVDLARAQPPQSRPLVFGAASVRFFEMTDLAGRARVVGSLGEVRLELARVANPSGPVWVTSELAGRDEASAHLRLIANLCRLARVQRATPCLGVYEWF